MGVAFIFPGQGSQSLGMGKELGEVFGEAKETFEEVDDGLGRSFCRDVMWAETPEELNKTENAQPALLAVSTAVLRVLLKQGGKSIQDMASFVAGHSLGEYSAWVAAGSLSFSDALRLVALRGRAMTEASPPGEGAMAAILGLPWATVETVTQKAAQQTGQVCVGANDNDPSQVVISGRKEAIETAIVLAKEAGARRALLLDVSVPSHSPLMAPVVEIVGAALEELSLQAPLLPIIPNALAEGKTDLPVLKKALIDQLTGRVRWRESVLFLEGQGVEKAIEIGSGRVLSGLVKRTTKQITPSSVGEPADVENVLKLL